MLRGWLKKEGNTSSQSLDALAEPQNLEAAMRAATHIMNDDLEGAEAGLGNGSSTFHKLGKGMVAFLRATLGFEQEIMREASERLADAESTASADHRRAQRDSHAFQSSIYPPGSEFALCHAQSQLMAAVIGVLNESLTESIKGFYKLRKAYLTLDTIMQAEARYMKNRNGAGTDSHWKESVDSLASHTSSRSLKATMPGTFGGGNYSQWSSKAPSIHSVEVSNLDVPQGNPDPMAYANGKVSEEEDEFYDADENLAQDETSTNASDIEMDGVTGHLTDLSLKEEDAIHLEKTITPGAVLGEHGLLDHDPESDIFANPIDVFIHSGANLVFGILLVMISMIPPAFGKLLFIIGFHGDKTRGLRLLWQASKFHNINGAMAALMILGYYNTLVGLSDVIPDTDSATLGGDQVEGYPKERCEALLAEMRRRYPNSHLWLLEESRMRASNKRLPEAIQILESSTKSTLKQVAALEMFEKSLDSMYIHNYALCSKSFIACVSLNSWSHTLYYYIAGSAELELYRQHKPLDRKLAAKHASEAERLLKLAPQHAGRKKFMARQLPFDTFVIRKIKKWESRAHERKVPFIDAVGVSPIEEMIFFWTGYKRMNAIHLEASLDRLNWSEDLSQNKIWTHEGHDEKAILAVLRAVNLRHLHRFDEAKRLLKTHVLSVPHAELKGGLKDDWTAPSAHYEMGVNCWMQSREAKEEGDAEGEEKWVRECERWTDRAAKWEGYELDARMGLKIATAQDTLKRWNEKGGAGKG